MKFCFGRHNTSCPCTQDCKRRSAECRLSCEDWKIYEAKKREEYAQRDKEREQHELRRAKTAGAMRRSRDFAMDQKRRNGW